MRSRTRGRAALLIALTIAVSTTAWGVSGGAGASAGAAKKPKCAQGEKGMSQIEPLFDINANTENSLKKRLSVVQFGQLKDVVAQMKIVDENNPVSDVRAKPQANIQFLDKVSATGDLTITFGTSSLDQGTQYFVCVGKKQNGTKKGAWRISLYSLCSLYSLNPCSDKLTQLAIDNLPDALLELTTQ
jgi:hypothetical protein